MILYFYSWLPDAPIIQQRLVATFLRFCDFVVYSIWWCNGTYHHFITLFTIYKVDFIIRLNYVWSCDFMKFRAIHGNWMGCTALLTWVIVFKLATMQVARSSFFIIIFKPWLVLVFQRQYLILPLLSLSFIADFLRMVVFEHGSLPGSIGEESIMFL